MLAGHRHNRRSGSVLKPRGLSSAPWRLGSWCCSSARIGRDHLHSTQGNCDPTTLPMSVKLPSTTLRCSNPSHGSAPRLRQLHAYGDCGAGDDGDVVGLVVGDVETAFDDLDRDLAMRQGGFDCRGVNLVGMLDSDRDLDLHLARVEPKGADQRQRAVMEGIDDRANGRLGIIAAVQIVAGSHFENDALCWHWTSPQGTSSRTSAAALAITVLLVPESLAISSPPSTTSTVPVPCGSTASTASLSTCSGHGTPIVTSTRIASTGRPTASATLSPLCHSASRSARTAALV